MKITAEQFVRWLTVACLISPLACATHHPLLMRDVEKSQPNTLSTAKTK